MADFTSGYIMSKSPPVMGIDVPGRVRNTGVPYGHAFLPVFEAVVNSIHAT